MRACSGAKRASNFRADACVTFVTGAVLFYIRGRQSGFAPLGAVVYAGLQPSGSLAGAWDTVELSPRGDHGGTSQRSAETGWFQLIWRASSARRHRPLPWVNDDLHTVSRFSTEAPLFDPRGHASSRGAPSQRWLCGSNRTDLSCADGGRRKRGPGEAYGAGHHGVRCRALRLSSGDSSREDSSGCRPPDSG